MRARDKACDNRTLNPERSDMKILMILTSHRLDCLKIALFCLERAEAYRHFDKVVFLLNGVEGSHKAYIEDYMKRRSDVPWDTVSGPRGRAECISSLENQCIERYPHAIYIKMDEDIFVGHGWAERMLNAYEDNATAQTALITPLIPNNAYGLHLLCSEVFPEAGRAYVERFGEGTSPAADGATWRLPSVAEWSTRRFMDVDKINKELTARTSSGAPAYQTFQERFSIGCICFDYEHWLRMGGVPAKDELEWCEWIESRKENNIAILDHVVLHYSFYVQQDWLDRTTLLEDIAAYFRADRFILRHGPRLVRTIRQIPSILRRRLFAR